MSWKSLAALLLAQLLAASVAAQSSGPGTSSEFGSVSGGQIELLPKGARRVSGSLGVTTMGSMPGYEATLGGTLLQDRIWFFGTASMLPGMPQRGTTGVVDLKAVDLKMDAQLDPRNSLAAAWSEGNATAPDLMTGALPSSFLSLRYSGVVSSNMMFNATIMRRSTTQPQSLFGN